MTQRLRPSRRRPPRKTTVFFLRDFPRALTDEVRALAALRRVRVSEIVAAAVREYLDRAAAWRRR